MPSDKIFVCKKCDTQYPKWAGRCLECGAWGSLQEEIISHRLMGLWPKKLKNQENKKSELDLVGMETAEVVRLGQGEKIKVERIASSFLEWDRVLGSPSLHSGETSGLVKGSLVMLGGDPGVGKSTLALQLTADISKKHNCLYVSAEESAEQVGSRLERLEIKAKNLGFINETNLEKILATLIKEKPDLAVIDSIQTVYTSELPSEAGSLNQVRACTVKILEVVKKYKLTVLIIGQVIKSGQLAGPKAAEHLVDVVLYLQGDKYKEYRILRSVKNRFGSLSEIGIWQMTRYGLEEVKNPSKIFLHNEISRPGTAIAAVAEGSRIFLVEVQALLTKSNYKFSKKTTSGFSAKRLDMLLAILNKQAGLNLEKFDIVVNLAGGLSLKEPALDLAVAGAIMSAWQDKALPKGSVIFGELGLSGEVRPVNKTKDRIKEAHKLGFKKIILPYFEAEVKNAELVKIKEIRDLNKIF